MNINKYQEDLDAKNRLVSLESGTAIDHIKKGHGLTIMDALDLDSDTTYSIAVNVPSKSMGRKDLVMIEHKELSEQEYSKIGFISSNATINIIKENQVIKKIKADLPDSAEGFIKCYNPNCITNFEDIPTKFKISQQPLKAKCFYCEKTMNENEITRFLK